MSSALSGDKEFLAAMVAATLQDLRLPSGISQDLMPKGDAAPELLRAWVDRHTVPQKNSRRNGSSGTFLGDAIYDHYTARAVLNGMPFDARGTSFTLREALLNLGVNEPETQIKIWQNNFALAAETGDRMMNLLNRTVLSNGRSNDLVDTENAENLGEAEIMGLPYGLDEVNEESVFRSSTGSLQELD